MHIITAATEDQEVRNPVAVICKTCSVLLVRDSSAVRWLFVRLALCSASRTKSHWTAEESRTSVLCVLAQPRVNKARV